MFRIGRDFRGLFVYEDDRPITNAVGEIIIIPIFMLIAPPVLILLFFLVSWRSWCDLSHCNVDCCICCILVFKAKHRIKTESHMCLV